MKFLPTELVLLSNVDLKTIVHVDTTLLKTRGVKSEKKTSKKKRKEGKPGGSVGNAAYVGVYQSRGCRIREKRAELTVERVYVKSSTVIDSLPSSTLLWVDHEGRQAEGGQGEGIGRKGGSG